MERVTLTLEEKAKALAASFPCIKGIHVDGKHINLGDVAEGGTIDDMPAADYYEYQFVQTVLLHKLAELDLCKEWYDPGTILAFNA